MGLKEKVSLKRYIFRIFFSYSREFHLCGISFVRKDRQTDRHYTSLLRGNLLQVCRTVCFHCPIKDGCLSVCLSAQKKDNSFYSVLKIGTYFYSVFRTNKNEKKGIIFILFSSQMIIGNYVYFLSLVLF